MNTLALKQLPMLIKREYWEHKGAMFYAPLTIAAFFAGIMMAMNFKSVDKKNQIPIVIGFSLLFTILVGFFTDIASTKLNTPSSLTNFLNLIGAGFLGEYFWNKKLGKSIKYRKRSTLIPFVLAIAFSAIVIWAILTEEGL